MDDGGIVIQVDSPLRSFLYKSNRSRNRNLEIETGALAQHLYMTNNSIIDQMFTLLALMTRPAFPDARLAALHCARPHCKSFFMVWRGKLSDLLLALHTVSRGTQIIQKCLKMRYTVLFSLVLGLAIGGCDNTVEPEHS